MPRNSVLKFALLSALLMTGCETSTVVDARGFAELARAQKKWNARSFADYSFEIRVYCFCPPEINQWNRVTVRGGAVTAVESVDADPQFPPTILTYWRPIDSLFVELYRAMSAPTSESYLAAVIVEYDDELGYPVSIEYRARPTVADGDAYYDLRNVRPLP